MPRMARLVVPAYPHHVTQRGSRRQTTFFEDADYQMYMKLLCERKEKVGVEIWAYCLMPNHVHFVAVPESEDGLASMFGVVHHRYSMYANSKNGWRGHLWQERFYSSVMDEAHLVAAVRYIELNPVRAGLCSCAEHWRWSSVHAHLTGAPDMLVATTPMLQRVSDWRKFLVETGAKEQEEELWRQTKTGRPAGDKDFVRKLEELTGKRLGQRKPGPKSKELGSLSP